MHACTHLRSRWPASIDRLGSCPPARSALDLDPKAQRRGRKSDGVIRCCCCCLSRRECSAPALCLPQACKRLNTWIPHPFESQAEKGFSRLLLAVGWPPWLVEGDWTEAAKTSGGQRAVSDPPLWLLSRRSSRPHIAPRQHGQGPQQAAQDLPGLLGSVSRLSACVLASINPRTPPSLTPPNTRAPQPYQ